MGSKGAFEGEYCEQCGKRQPVKRTVPWQADFCTVCGSPVEE